MENKKLIPAKELAPYLSISPKTLYQWAELRQIPSYKVNGCLRFNLEEVMEWIEACKIASSCVMTSDPVSKKTRTIRKETA
jgi:excisionase family DNA binding protein